MLYQLIITYFSFAHGDNETHILRQKVVGLRSAVDLARDYASAVNCNKVDCIDACTGEVMYSHNQGHMDYFAPEASPF